ncbi:MAG: ribulose-phosphate 3-epimerase [Ruminococcus sp.]|nr:ribulose-phosphate 3-epimerase [Ruminococcus sp.]
MGNFVSASILSADLLNLESEIKKLEEADVNMVHFDVMDGVFVNNISFGIPVLEKLSKASRYMELDVHLMITAPLKYVKAFDKAGADIITFHLESESDTAETIRTIYEETDCTAGLAIKPDTPAEAVFPYIDMGMLDMILVMTVEPGFGGQKFMDMSEKIRKIREYADSVGEYELDIEVDGGINADTADIVKKAGANVLVSGSYLFKAENMKETVNILRAEI